MFALYDLYTRRLNWSAGRTERCLPHCGWPAGGRHPGAAGARCATAGAGGALPPQPAHQPREFAAGGGGGVRRLRLTPAPTPVLRPPARAAAALPGRHRLLTFRGTHTTPHYPVPESTPLDRSRTEDSVVSLSAWTLHLSRCELVSHAARPRRVCGLWCVVSLMNVLFMFMLLTWTYVNVAVWNL